MSLCESGYISIIPPLQFVRFSMMVRADIWTVTGIYAYGRPDDISTGITISWNYPVHDLTKEGARKSHHKFCQSQPRYAQIILSIN